MILIWTIKYQEELLARAGEILFVFTNLFTYLCKNYEFFAPNSVSVLS